MSMFALFCRVLWDDREKSVFWHLRWHLIAIGCVVWGARELASLIFG